MSASRCVVIIGGGFAGVGLARSLRRKLRSDWQIVLISRRFAAIGHRSAVGKAFGIRVSGFPAWVLWHGIYWAKMPTLGRKLQIAFDWGWDLFFPRDLVQLPLERTRPADSARDPSPRPSPEAQPTGEGR